MEGGENADAAGGKAFGIGIGIADGKTKHQICPVAQGTLCPQVHLIAGKRAALGNRTAHQAEHIVGC